MMSMKAPSAALLPNGLLDLLPPQAESEAATIDAFMRVFSAFGYARVKPPMVEFEESLLAPGPGEALARNTFRMMDPVSRRMMGVRADVTAQIARIATSRLADETRPLRLSYAADVLRVNGTQLRPERQFCQVGCEMIGEDSVQADAEMALIALKALSDAGIKGLSIDLTVPPLVESLYEDLGALPAEQDILNDLVEKRDADSLQQQNTEAARLILSLMACEGTADAMSSRLAALTLPRRARDNADKLLAAAGELQRALAAYGLPDIQITLSPLERRGFEYQTGTSFTLFSRNARGELGRGGRYTVNRSGETATGFTLYMDTVLTVVPAKKEDAIRPVSVKGGWESLKKQQDAEGKAVRQS